MKNEGVFKSFMKLNRSYEFHIGYLISDYISRIRPEGVITLFGDTRWISYVDLVLLKLMSRLINPYEPYLNKISVLGGFERFGYR